MSRPERSRNCMFDLAAIAWVDKAYGDPWFIRRSVRAVVGSYSGAGGRSMFGMVGSSSAILLRRSGEWDGLGRVTSRGCLMGEVDREAALCSSGFSAAGGDGRGAE